MSNCQIVAHRGASHLAPENTLPAFRLAWENGIRIVEGDFRLTSDGRIVCMHDHKTGRVADRDLVVSETSFSELRELDLGSWKGKAWAGEKIPALDEVFEEMPDDGTLFLEVKCGVELFDVLARLSFDRERVVIISFSEEVLTYSKRVMPELKVLWLGQHPVDKVLGVLERTGADGFGSQRHRVLDANYIDALHKRGKEVNVWTVDDVKEAERYVAAGVDYVTTNRPMYIRDNMPAG